MSNKIIKFGRGNECLRVIDYLDKPSIEGRCRHYMRYGIINHEGRIRGT